MSQSALCTSLLILLIMSLSSGLAQPNSAYAQTSQQAEEQQNTLLAFTAAVSLVGLAASTIMAVATYKSNSNRDRRTTIESSFKEMREHEARLLSLTTLDPEYSAKYPRLQNLLRNSIEHFAYSMEQGDIRKGDISQAHKNSLKQWYNNYIKDDEDEYPKTKKLALEFLT